MKRAALCFAASLALAASARGEASPAASQPDPYVARPRIVVMTDIANEPDDQMSMVRLLVYANQFDVEGLVATTSTWMKNRVRPDVIHSLVDAYAQVQPNLLAARARLSGRRRAADGGRARAAGLRHGRAWAPASRRRAPS